MLYSRSVLFSISYIYCCSVAQSSLILYKLMTVAHQVPLSMGFSKKEYWSGFLFPSSGHLPDPGIKLMSPASPALAGRFLPLTWKSSEIAQSCSTLCDPMDCSQPGSSVRGIFQARRVEWVSISSSRGSFWSKDQTRVSCVSYIAGGFFAWAVGEPQGIDIYILLYIK